MKPTKILVMDDDEETLDILEAGFMQHGYEIITTSSTHDAVALCKNDPPDLAILDVYLPGSSGIDAAIDIKRETSVPFLFLSASDEKDIVQRAVAVGALGYLVKPIDIFQLIPAVETALVRAKDISMLQLARERLNQALSDGRETSIAVGLIMERFRVNEEEAFNLLRTQARSRNIKIAVVADEIVAAAETLNVGGK